MTTPKPKQHLTTIVAEFRTRGVEIATSVVYEAVYIGGKRMILRDNLGTIVAERGGWRATVMGASKWFPADGDPYRTAAVEWVGAHAEPVVPEEEVRR